MSNSGFFIPVLVVVGPGLIGGSVAAALKKAGCVGKVIGVSRQPATTAAALRLGLIDEIADLEQAVPQADVILLATANQTFACASYFGNGCW